MTATDVDECTEKTANCPGNSKCVNTPGSYRCECPAGDCKGSSTAFHLSGLRDHVVTCF